MKYMDKSSFFAFYTSFTFWSLVITTDRTGSLNNKALLAID